jgi:Flp pilus assembly protein TadB
MNALQLWILAGLMVSGGLVAIGWYFAPAQPDLADALGRVSPVSGARQPVVDTSERPELADRLGLWAMRHLPGRLWGRTPQRDLAILGRSVHRFYGGKLLFALIVAAGVPLLAAIFSMTFVVPTAVTIVAVLMGALFGWLVPNGNVATAAAEARLEFNRALGSYVDLVALERSAGGSAARQALENAAEIGDSWPFRRIRDELARSRFSGETPWDAMNHLAGELGLPALDDVADIMRLAGAEGSQVYDTLRARSTALRSALLAAEHTKANALSGRMTIPTTVMAIVFCVILVTPAVLRLAAG